MAVTLTGANGLFTRLGKIGFVIEKIRDHQNLNPNGLKKEIEDVVAEYSAADQKMLSGLPEQIVSIQTNAMNPLSQLRATAVATVIQMVNADNPQPDLSLPTAIRELIKQMRTASATVQRNASNSAAVAYDSLNTGNGTAFASVLDTDVVLSALGVNEENIRDEDVTLTCTADAQFQGIAGRETFAVLGEQAVPDGRHPDWPDTRAGSGIASSIRVSDPAETGTSTPGRTLLTNGAFETFTVLNTPDNWTIAAGAVGTDIFEEGTLFYRGAKALALKNTAKLTQTLNTAGQTVGKMRPGTKYLLVARTRADAATTATTAVIQVQDGAGAVLAGGNASIGVSLTTSYVAVSAFFNSPLVLPSTGIKCVIDLQGITATKKVYIDDLMLVPVVKFGASGPSIIVSPGSTPWKLLDRIIVTITNDHSGKFQKLFDLLFGMYDQGLKLPFDSSPSISDSLIA